jgi:hypothetical protein
MYNNPKTNKQNELKAKFIKKVTTMTSSRKTYDKFDFNKADDGLKYQLASRKDKHYKSSLKIGDRVFVAKMRDNLRTENYIWDIYLIKLPKCRMGSDLPQTRFHNKTYIIL